MTPEEGYREAERRIAEAKKKQATELDLSELALMEVPEALGNLQSLQTLALGYNQLASLPEALGNLKSLQKLDLTNNQLASLPEALGNLKSLQKLFLYNNQLASLSEALGNLTSLQKLALSDNQLASLPEALGNLKSLQKLDLSNNQLASLPESLGNLQSLQTLSLSNNELASLPKALGNLQRLQTLYLSGNQLASLPEALGNLTSLQALYLSGNQLASLPEALGNLQSLQTLWLNHNQLTSLPEALRSLAKLERLFLHGNPELNLPPEILGPPWEKVTKETPPTPPQEILDWYFPSRTETRRPLKEAKLILIGEGEVGKTSLVAALIHNKKANPKEKRTEKINIDEWKEPGIDGNDGITLHVWDFGGQEIMHATHQFFLTKRSIYLIVLAARKEEEGSQYEKWLQMVRNFAGDSPFFVVINKAETYPFEVNVTRLKKDFPEQFKGLFCTSCSTLDGIPELRKAVWEIARKVPHVNDAVPETYFRIKERLLEEAKARDYFDILDYRKICQEKNLPHESEQMGLIRFLHDLGMVINFNDDQDSRQLKETPVLNPEWITGAVYKIINDRDLLTTHQARLSFADLHRILNDPKYPEKTHDLILSMMEKFELCFAMQGNQKTWLVPELLSKNEIDFDWKLADSLNFQYHYPNGLPPGIISRFIVRRHQNLDPKKQQYWRYGAKFRIEDNPVLVRSGERKDRIFITVQGPEKSRRQALAVVRDTFFGIHSTMPALPVVERVPLPGQEEFTVSYETLLANEREGIEEFIPEEGPRKKVSTKVLLEGVVEDDQRMLDQLRYAKDAFSRMSQPYLIEPLKRNYEEEKVKSEIEKNQAESRHLNAKTILFIAIGVVVLVIVALSGSLEPLAKFAKTFLK